MHPGGSLSVRESEWPTVDNLIALQQLVPELGEVFERRYNILKMIKNEAPVGRRFMAARLGSSERVIRGELDVLREQGLILTSSTVCGFHPRVRTC